MNNYSFKKNSASIDFLSDKQLKKEVFAFGGAGEKINGMQSTQNLNRKKIDLMNSEEDDNFSNLIRNQTLSSRKSVKNEDFLLNFQENERSKVFSDKKMYNIAPPSYYLKPASSSKQNPIEKKHSISFFEQPKMMDEQNKILRKMEENNNFNKFILRKYESNKDKTLENIVEENEKKEKNMPGANENNLKKVFLEKENFTLRIENRNLKKNIDDLKTEIGLFKHKLQEVDLLSDKDRTIGENIDLKKANEAKDKEIIELKEEKQNLLQKIQDLSESNNMVSQVNFSIEEKMKKQMTMMENNYKSKIKFLMEENKRLVDQLERKEKEIQNSQELSKNYYSKTEEDFKFLLHSHKEFSLAMEKFAKSHQNYKK